MVRRPTSTASRSAGFTLLEFMIALVVLLTGLSALWALHSAAITSNANAYRLGVATILAQDAMEQLFSETLVAGYANSALDPSFCGGTGSFPAVDPDGLDSLPCSVDGAAGGGVRVNGLGNSDPTTAPQQGPVIFLRTYHVEPALAGSTDRFLVRVRVTYGDPNTGKRHGVTVGATRLVDSYDPRSLGPT